MSGRVGAGPWTVVSFHAHPDDEALLTAGTLARAVAEGHRVVLVVATSGEAGLAAGSHDAETLGRTRRAELVASSGALGAARVVFLGHPDSGSSPGDGAGDRRGSFATLDPAVVAVELAAVLTAEDADVLTTYDAAGGYGHPDHIQVHSVGQRAAEMAGTPVVLEATIDRDRILRATRVLRRLSRVVDLPFLPDMSAAFTPRSRLTHRVDVRPHLDAKIASLRAHASQTGSSRGLRTIALLLMLPRPLRSRVLGTEWFREVGRPAPKLLHDDIFLTLRGPQGPRRSGDGESPSADVQLAESASEQ